MINTELSSLPCGILQGCWFTLLLDFHAIPHWQATGLQILDFFSDKPHTVGFNELSNINVKKKDIPFFPLKISLPIFLKIHDLPSWTSPSETETPSIFKFKTLLYSTYLTRTGFYNASMNNDIKCQQVFSSSSPWTMFLHSYATLFPPLSCLIEVLYLSLPPQYLPWLNSTR